MTRDEINNRITAFRAQCYERGESVQDYCRRNKLDYNAMSMVLRGRSRGIRGEAHKVYVALGLKSSHPKK